MLPSLGWKPDVLQSRPTFTIYNRKKITKMHKNTAYFKVHFELDYLHTWVHLNRNEGLVDLRRPIQVLRTNNSYHHSRYRFFGATKFEINQMKVNYWLYHILMFYADKIVYSLYAFSQYIYPKIIFFTNCTILQFIYLQ